MDRNQTTDGTAYQDLEDDGGSINAVIPFGSDWTGGGYLLLHQIRRTILIQRGEMRFFFGRWVAHNIVDIKGLRNGLDYIVSQRVMKEWAPRWMDDWGGGKYVKIETLVKRKSEIIEKARKSREKKRMQDIHSDRK